jgi:hypothetical protein
MWPASVHPWKFLEVIIVFELRKRVHAPERLGTAVGMFSEYVMIFSQIRHNIYDTFINILIFPFIWRVVHVAYIQTLRQSELYIL